MRENVVIYYGDLFPFRYNMAKEMGLQLCYFEPKKVEMM